MFGAHGKSFDIVLTNECERAIRRAKQQLLGSTDIASTHEHLLSLFNRRRMERHGKTPSDKSTTIVQLYIHTHTHTYIHTYIHTNHPYVHYTPMYVLDHTQ